MKRGNLSMCLKYYLSIFILTAFTALSVGADARAADGFPDTNFGLKDLVTSNFGSADDIADGYPDTSFGFDGLVVSNIGSGDDIGYDIAIQSDNKIVIAGESENNFYSDKDKDFAVVRYTKSGGLDYSFGNGGKITADFGGNDTGRAVAVQTDGKIVVSGYSETDGDFALVRYTSNGDLDNTFGTCGKVTASFSNYDMCFDIAVQSDGKIVAAGTSSESNQDIAVARYNSDGTLDTGFGSGGVAVTPIGTGDESGHGLILRPDGKIIVTGYSDNGSDKDFAVLQYNTDGTLDTGFGTGGKVTTPIGNGDDLCYAGAIQPDGKIVLAGYSYNGSDYDFAAVRYDTDGSPDTEFGTGGKVTARIGTGDDFGYALTIQQDGKIVIAGKSHNGSDYDFAAVRYNSDGTPDTDFGTDGRVTTAIGTGDDGGFGVAIQPDGNIVVTGNSYGYFNNVAAVRYLSGNMLPPEPDKVKITASDGAKWDNFGNAVSISGDYAIAGALRDGSAYIFKKDGRSWSQQAKIVPNDGKLWDLFGYSVSVSGDHAIVGACGDDENGDSSGSAYIFEKDEPIWSQQARIIPNDGKAGDSFGRSVSISGNYAIVGAYDNGYRSGSAYILKKHGTFWSIQTKVTANDGAEYDNFGWSVSISGDYAIVGAWGASNDDDNGDTGSAYIFKRGETSWSQQAKIIASDRKEWGNFGYPVSISGDYVIVGASNSAYIFKRDGSTWNQQIKVAGDSIFHLGNAVSISSDYAVVGVNRYGNTTLTHIFKRDGANWNQETIFTADGVRDGSVSAISGESVIVGFRLDNDYTGSADIYTLPQAVSSYEKGDINGDNTTDLADAVIALKVTAGVNIDDMTPAGYSVSDIDVNGDNRIGMEEVLYIMKKILFE